MAAGAPMPSDPRDYKLDLSTGSQVAARRELIPGERPFLSVHFACCNIYLRLYRAPNAKAYDGRCPRCGKSVRFPVGEGGTTARIFRVS
jgi:hypothetical protein